MYTALAIAALSMGLTSAKIAPAPVSEAVYADADSKDAKKPAAAPAPKAIVAAQASLSACCNTGKISIGTGKIHGGCGFLSGCFKKGTVAAAPAPVVKSASCGFSLGCGKNLGGLGSKIGIITK
ncbi:MAG: hypothetical protein EXS09_02265 [Gemmataceae bacterium]|nr:hypothetical protein [Gemmataceae bacterium]